MKVKLLKSILVYPQIIFIFYIIQFSCSHDNKRNLNDNSNENTSIDELLFVEPTKSNNGMLSGKLHGCAYSNLVESNKIVLSEPGKRAKEQIKQILEYSGLPINFKVFAANIDNAIALMANGERVVLFDPELLKLTDKSNNSFWSSWSILAHEIGHHLAGHTLKSSNKMHKQELEADKFSGFILQKLGAKIDQATSAINTHGLDVDTRSHPNKKRRLQAIIEGWEEANTSRIEAAIPPPPEDINWLKGRVFETEYLIDEESYTDLLSKNGYGYWTSDIWSGVIFELDRSKDFLLIHVTDIGNNSVDGYSEFINNKIEIRILDFTRSNKYLGNAGIANLKSILEVGRRIKFAFTEQGSKPNLFLVYLEYPHE